MTGSGAELSSLATALDELTTRITAIADRYAASERDELATDLYAVARAPPAGSSADGQKSLSTQSTHRGRRATHTRRPWRISLRLNDPHSAAGSSDDSSCSALTGSVCVVRPSRRLSRPTWVSTGRPGRPRPTLRMTLAVLRPTPGSVVRSSTVDGTTPPKRSTSAVAMPFKLRDLLRKKPVGRISSSSCPSSTPASSAGPG